MFTGGGTAGHVMPNLALIEAFEASGDECLYVGSPHGIEARLVGSVPFYGIASGKLRRYFAWKNFTDPFLILWGTLQAILLCLRHKPDVVFSKGGFVAVPVVVAAWLCRIPAVCHESDVTPGLANRICVPLVRRVCVNFEQTLKHVPAGKAVLTGTPVRESLLQGSREQGLAFLGFADTKPVLLIFGGSLGAAVINRQVWQVLPQLLQTFAVCHVVGDGQVDETIRADGYRQLPFIGAEFGDVLAAADIVVSRAGANSIYELLVLRKPHLLIPLSAAASRGDQLINARTFSAEGLSQVLEEPELNDDSFLGQLDLLRDNAGRIKADLEKFNRGDSVRLIQDIIIETAGKMK